MYRMKIDLADLARHYGKLGGKVKQAIRSGVLSGAHRCVPILVQSARTASPASPGGFTGAWGGGGAPNYISGFRALRHPLGAMVFNTMPYAGVIERGRRPGTGVSREGQFALATWVKRRMGIADPKKAKGIAFLIARKIKARGLRARFVMGRVFKQMQAAVIDEINEFILEALKTS
jgi:hypothetical protein